MIFEYNSCSGGLMEKMLKLYSTPTAIPIFFAKDIPVLPLCGASGNPVTW